MITVEKFKQMEMLEQLEALETIKKNKNDDCITELYDLFTHPLGDDAIDYMVGMTLRELLIENEQATVSGLTHDNSEIQKLCLQICGQHSFASAAPALRDLFKNEKDSKMIHELFLAIAKSDSKEFLEIFQNFIGHPEEDIAAIAIDMIGKHQDETSVDQLCDIIEMGEADEKYKECDLITAAAIEALGRMSSEKALSFLVSKLQYRNPTGRFLIHQVLVKKGSAVIPFFKTIFEKADVDQKIMAANVLGLIGDSKGGEMLIAAMEQETIKDPNVKYAVYEALGNMPFQKGTDCLIKGLFEQDPLLLTVVIMSLDSQANSDVIRKLVELIRKGDQQGKRLVQAIVTAGAMSIFETLYQEHDLAGFLVEKIVATQDQDKIDAFREKLAAIDSAAAQKDAAALSGITVAKGEKRVLVADDSKAMRAFLQTTLSGFGVVASVAGNGKDAFDIIAGGASFDLILTEMVMPVMDGIEFIRLVRKHPEARKTPVVMISTESKMSQIELAKQAGVNEFVCKPFTSEKLWETIKKLR